LISVALFTVLATMAVSCQKENIVEPQNANAEVGTVRVVRYVVDGVAHCVTLYSDAEWDAFVNSMLSLSAQGHEVSFTNESARDQISLAKDYQVFVTTSLDEAQAWTKAKADLGYTVSMTYKDGQYICEAIL
jgi:hypothetical protein